MSAPTLTYREQQILPLIAEGMSDTEIGAALWISPHTAKSQIHGLFSKLGARNRPNAVHIAHQLGLLASAGMTPHVRYVLLRQLLADPEVAAVMVADRGASVVPR